MPIIDVFESKSTVTPDEMKAMLGSHESKLRNLRLTLLDFLFDAELKQDFMTLGNIGISNPAVRIFENLHKKYGNPPLDESLMDPPDKQALDQARVMADAFKNTRSIGYALHDDLINARRMAEDLVGLVDDMLEAVDISRIADPYRCLPPAGKGDIETK